MNQFVIDAEQVQGDRLTLVGDEARHAASVLRFRAGDAFWATDGQGRRWKAQVESASPGSVDARVLQAEAVPEEWPRITVGLGMLKKRDRMEFALEKLTELGASGILLMRTDHSERDSLRADRAELIVKSALKQSMGAWMPKVALADSLRAACEGGAWNGGEARGRWSSIVQADETLAADTASYAPSGTESDILLLIGPEGGFSARETAWLNENVPTLRKMSLGTRRLRAETAAIAGLLRLRWTL
jgi:16S rRNA (uracil1498-N3)-methyltransferase